MKVLVGAYNQEKALHFVIVKLREGSFPALVKCRHSGATWITRPTLPPLGSAGVAI